MSLPKIASRDEWVAARTNLLAKEKELTKRRDALNAQRCDLPLVEIEKDYTFDGPDGNCDGRSVFADVRDRDGFQAEYKTVWDA
jgi:predicted dithiol-disulfide oxidoreductase (DUF899 family)